MNRKSWLMLLVVILSLSLVLAGCGNTASTSAPAAPTKPPTATPQQPQPALSTDRPQATWTQDYITKVAPIMMKDPFLGLLGQTTKPIPYTYEQAVMLSGHSCGAISGAWTITRKALEALYPNEIPVRGQIKITAPGAEDEWYVGVFGETMTYITGAAPKTGFPGSEFGQAYNRRNLMVYTEEPTGTPPAKMVWIFERIDTGAKVGVTYDLTKVMPPSTPERNAMSTKMAQGTATPEEAKDWITYWNARAIFVLENADTLPGFFKVEVLK